MAKEQGRKVVAQNRKARHDYHIEDTFEAGIVLTGTEVKSLRAGRASLVDGYADVDGRRGVAAGRAHPRVHRGHLDQPRSAPFAQAAAAPQGDRRDRSATRESGITIVPLALYFKDGRAKVEIGLARGKREYDKRQTIAKREADRDAARALATRNAHGRARGR